MTDSTANKANEAIATQLTGALGANHAKERPIAPRTSNNVVSDIFRDGGNNGILREGALMLAER